MSKIKCVIGFSSLEDFYDMNDKVLGKGKYGLVKEAIHKKTFKRVAVKILKKADMSKEDLESQK